MPSKLCPHALTTPVDLRRFVEAGAPLVKLAAVFGPAEELLALNPNLLVVGRVVESEDIGAEADSGRPPEASALAFLERQRGQYERNHLIRIWEGPNEPVFGAAHEPAAMRRMAWYAAFEAERLRLLTDLGLRGVVGNFATGNPDLPMWTAFLPALDAAERFRGYLGLHEYSAPCMWWLTGKFQSANCEGEVVADEGDTGWTTLRYRKVYRQYLAPNGVGDVPLVITECGLDRIGVPCPGQSDGPWRLNIDYWSSYDGAQDPIDYWRGPERDPERYFAEQLIWYDRELQRDPYVVGATIFTVGATDQWREYDIAGTRVMDVLMDHIRASRAAAAVPPRATVMPPQPAAPAVSEPTQPETVRVPPGPEPARPARPAASNLLANAGFEDGQAYFADDTRERAVPAGWLLEYAGSDEPLEPGQSGPYGQPLTVLINSRAVSAADRARVFVAGAYCWKVCGGRAPFRVRLWQALAGLEPGRAYRFSANVLPDVLVRLQPRSTYASEPLASEVRLVIDMAGENADSGWRTGQATPFGRYSRLAVDFTAGTSSVVVAVEVRCRYPLPLAAWYFDELSLTPL
jgi:hypothetical protein